MESVSEVSDRQNKTDTFETKTDASFTSSAVELEVDHEALHLGTIPKQLTATTARAASNNFGRANVTADVIHLQHSTLGGKPATLVAFNFQFRFDQRGTNRFSRAEIRLAFNSHGTNPGTTPKPAVKHFGPALICGPTTIGETTKSAGVSPSINTPALGVQAGVQASIEKSTTVAREFQMKIIGAPYATDRRAEDDDMMIWRISENPGDPNGIPGDFKAAALVQHKGSGEVFQATVQIKVRTRMGMSLFGWPWSKPTPLVISDKESFGSPMTTPFDSLKESDWAQMTEFPGLVSVCRPYFKAPIETDDKQRIRVTNTSKERVV
jgi:hypothetical protein